MPSWALYPTVAVATMATVIASQALISGAYSLTQQAISLGYFPRCTIIHTSKDVSGQIYIPEVNYALLVLCLVLVLAFGSSTNLAAAYGIAVTGTMGITTIVYWVVLRETWGWPLWRASLLAGSFLVVDLAFFGANAVKIAHGGWVPLAMATALFAIMTTWKAGRRELALKIRADMLPFDIFMDDVRESKPHRVKGTAVFMASAASGTPPVLLHHFKHNQVLHKTVILLSIETMRVPEVAASKRLEVIPHGEGVYRIIARYGFMEAPNVPTLLAQCAELGVPAEPGSTSYYLGRETLLASGQSKMAHWRKGLFAFISRNARSATAYFGLPPNRVVELGMQVDL